jgi:hypothetical protein
MISYSILKGYDKMSTNNNSTGIVKFNGETPVSDLVAANRAYAEQIVGEQGLLNAKIFLASQACKGIMPVPRTELDINVLMNPNSTERHVLTGKLVIEDYFIIAHTNINTTNFEPSFRYKIVHLSELTKNGEDNENNIDLSASFWFTRRDADRSSVGVQLRRNIMRGLRDVPWDPENPNQIHPAARRVERVVDGRRTVTYNWDPFGANPPQVVNDLFLHAGFCMKQSGLLDSIIKEHMNAASGKGGELTGRASSGSGRNMSSAFAGSGRSEAADDDDVVTM